jgi:protein gp37
MSDGTKIEWTDATWNPINGCSVKSPGCTNCYAMKQAHRFPVRQGLTVKTSGGMVWTGAVSFNDKVLEQPLRWSRPRMIFVCAHGDLFHENVPTKWIDLVFAVMAAAPQHKFQVLTKRPERMREYAYEAMGCGEHWLADCERSHAPMWPLPNVWLGTSVEDQKRADERIPILLDTPAALRWLSMEPLLGPVDVEQWLHDEGCPATDTFCICSEPREVRVDWIVAGGESGPKARPMHPDWIIGIQKQCEAAGVPFLFKQWGEHIADTICSDDVRSYQYPPGHVIYTKVGKKAAGRLLYGVEHNGFPTLTGDK